MNQRVHPQNYLDREEGDERRTLFWNFTASFVCHFIVFAVLIFAPGYAKGRKPSLSVMNVSLVTLPSQGKMPLPEKKNAVESKKPSVTEKKAPKISAKTKPEKISKPSPSISLNPKKKVKTSLKKKTFKTEKVVKSAIDRIEKKVDESRSDQIKQAIARLEKQVEKTGPKDLKNQQNIRGGGIPGGTGASSKKALELIDIYRIEIAYRIQKNWAFSDQLAGGRTDLEAWVAIKVMQNGEIKDVWFDKRSGNSYFDEAAKNAITKSNPLPPIPKAYVRPYIEAGFHFTLSGISK
ncbi:MAG: TonB family protein [Deltaproteobacteria bacterium]|jgi:colicin import membrane protein|nr:TonB family protein [Deltaproteobacteria bacterium]MBW2238318.1 TonB family protein [Deltaproteobacteria bacterium]MBW2571419.1 TonB family protein [Deltaproteobacteria bacterium]MBW2670038.1 TonB family protein [Deltaproteobacteria bacterium]MBW2710506.1 TonB family protein [Deltaproteobacteria bacterium]